jgi:hypothetical protein
MIIIWEIEGELETAGISGSGTELGKLHVPFSINAFLI